MAKTLLLTAADGHAFDAYVSEPAGRPRGAVIVVQEIFGVNSHIRSVADAYAAEGYLAIAPALFDREKRGYQSGYSEGDIAAGFEVMKKMQWDNVVRDIAATLEQAKAAGKVGIVGYCWGGAVSWVAAARVPGLAAASCYYGGAIPGVADLQPQCPVMFHWGETDGSIPLATAKEVSAKHPAATSHFYSAGHGFNCDQRGSFDAASAKLARERTLAFFRQHVG